MNVKGFFIFVAVLAVAYAVGFLLFPTTLTNLYGDAGGPPVNLAYRFFGVALLGVGLIFWLAKDCEDPTAIRALLMGGAISDVAGIAVSIWGSARGIMNALGWSVVLIYVVLLVGSVYFLQQRPASEPR
jgi:FtsH-binding integral membrane protein